MNKKNRVVYLTFIIISITLTGCFPWNAEEKSIDIVQQTVIIEEKKAEPDSLSLNNPEIVTQQEVQTNLLQEVSINQLLESQTISNTPPIKKRSRRARRCRKENKNVAIPQSIENKNQHPHSTRAPDTIVNTPIIQEQKTTTTPDNRLEKNKNRTIEIRNAISVDELAVKHWTGTYTPTKLAITINDVPFTIVGTDAAPLGTTKKVPCAENNVTVQYTYEFLNGMRKGSDTVTYAIDETTSSLPMHFSWDTAWHVELDGAQRK